jgi:hypothetical protein
MTALEELRAAVTNQRFATGNDDALLGRAIVELANQVKQLEDRLTAVEAPEEADSSDESDA